MMAPVIFFFVKVFEQEKYANDFLDGILYMNKLPHFRKIEETAEANRADKHEGIKGWFQPNQIVIKVNNFDINSLDMVSPASIKLDYFNNFNIFCLYAAHSGCFKAITKENLSDFKKQLEIPEECLNLGKYAVVITNAFEFINRVMNAAILKGDPMAGLVDYYDPALFNGIFSDKDVIFKKRNEYRHQREYRFAINPATTDTNPLLLDIGNIRDISHMCNSESINKSININLPTR